MKLPSSQILDRQSLHGAVNGFPICGSERPEQPERGVAASETVSRTVIGRLRSTSVDCRTRAGIRSATVATPELALIVPASTPSSVDFPEPFGPITASDEPLGISIVRLLRATASP